jgi:hypothetical protein
MAKTVHLSSTGTPASPYDTWASAASTVAQATAAMEAGDTLAMDKAFYESGTTSVTYTLPGTEASPCYWLCGTPAALAGLASLDKQTTAFSAYGFILNGSFRAYGLRFNLSNPSMGIMYVAYGVTGNTGNVQVFDNCDLWITGVGGTSSIAFGPTASASTPSLVILKDCTLRFGASGQRLIPYDALIIEGGSVAAGGTTPTALFSFGDNLARNVAVEVNDFDMTNLSSGVNLTQHQVGYGVMDFNACRLPSSWTGAMIRSGYAVPGARVRLNNCNAGAVNYYFAEQDGSVGTIATDAVVVRTGGMTDGTTPVSWKMACTSTATRAVHPLTSGRRVLWNETTGSDVTLTAHFIHNGGAKLKDSELVLAVTNVLNSASYPLGARVTSEPATLLTAAADLDVSTEAWDSQAPARQDSHTYVLNDPIKVASNAGRVFFCITAGQSASSVPSDYASAVDGGSVSDGAAVFRAGWRQKVAVTLTGANTPAMKGLLQWQFRLAKETPAAYTVYLDPHVEVS